MSGLLIGALLCAAAAFVFTAPRLVPVTPRPVGGYLRSPLRPVAAIARLKPKAAAGTQDAVAEQIRLLWQIAALLEAGRPLGAIWADLLAARSSSSATDQTSTPDPVADVLRTVSQSARWGHDGLEELRKAAHALPGVRSGASGQPLGRLWVQSWSGLADCVEISRSTGAPLASLVERHAQSCNESLDAEAARATALAGPQATVRILRWLPLGGLLVGYLMGADSIAVLFGTTVGWVLLFVAAALMIASELWVRRMLRAAAS